MISNLPVQFLNMIFTSFLLEYNLAWDTFGVGMVFSVTLAMMKMYGAQNVYIVENNLGGGSLQHIENNR